MWKTNLRLSRQGPQFTVGWSNIESGQIVATSHDLTIKGSVLEGKWDPLFQENLGW